MRSQRCVATLSLAGIAALLGGCNAGSAPSTPGALRAYHLSAGARIQHDVIVVQENRSFNNLFEGYPGATTAASGKNSRGKAVKLQPVGLEATWDLGHSSTAFFAACNGTGSIPGTHCRMNGFDKEWYGCGRSGPKCPNANPPYSYVPRSETKPYFSMAAQYV